MKYEAKAARLLMAICNADRVKILRALIVAGSDGMRIAGLAQVTGIVEGTISAQLKLMRADGLIMRDVRGQLIYYHLTIPGARLQRLINKAYITA